MEKIINHPAFQKQLEEIAILEERELSDVQKEAEQCIRELYTEQHPVSNIVAIQGFQYLLSRAYEKKIDLDPKGIKKLMKLVRNHPVAFVMTHKTYLDTLVLMVTLAKYGMPVPYIFGGINMAFLGLKQVGKKSGFIFIRRQFKDNNVYKASLRHYISTLISDGHHLTWNIEGARSRTGKIVYPQMGILKYIKEAEQASNRKVKYIPVSIVYDLIPDVKEMTEQSKGKAKKAESFGVFIDYVKKLNRQFGRAAIRFGDPVDAQHLHGAIIPDMEEDSYSDKNTLPRFAFEVIHHANQITPVTTVSLVCHMLLSNFSMTKKEMEIRVAKLMSFIEKRQEDVLLDRGKPIGKSIQKALRLLQKSGIVQKTQLGLKAQYCLASDEYLRANYYANMSSGHLYHRAFIELALVKIADDKSSNRLLHFWKEIMRLRDLFKFEFFYTNKAKFSDEIEEELQFFDTKWRTIISDPKENIKALLEKQTLFISESVLLNYLEAYQVVCCTLMDWNTEEEFTEKAFISACMFKGKDLHWQGHIRRLDSVTKPFLTNGYRLVKNNNLLPVGQELDEQKLRNWLRNLEITTNRLTQLNDFQHELAKKGLAKVPIEMEVVPGSFLEGLSSEIIEEEKGSHIAAFFDLDRTLINDFSAKKFVQSRLLSGKSSARELLAQYATILIYAAGSRDFEMLTKISAQGVKGISEEEFVELGEDVYMKYLAGAIYPESRALVASHFEKGHRVVIISAATAYQVNPVARDLGVEDVYCTRMEVEEGVFTGELEEICWGEGKANAAKDFAAKNNIDLSKSYFYTDSAEDYPLLEIIGKPQAVNPDKKLSQMAFENSWHIHRFEEPLSIPLVNSLRTGLAFGSIYPALLKGLMAGAMNLSQSEGINAVIAGIGDIGCRMAGLDIVIRGKENLESHRPAVFCFNHQSNADFFIVAKILRHDLTAMAKKELNVPPLGSIFKAMGVVFIDRSNKAKAIEAFGPAVQALKNGVSVAIAPEGTRSATRQLGQFKKGAFHLAMEGGVPIVPIVIKNAHDSMPKGSAFLKPTTIEVVALAPIETASWQVKNIDKHIKEVRSLYLRELEQLSDLNN